MPPVRKLLDDAIKLFGLSRIEAEALLCHLLGKDRVFLYIAEEVEVDEEEFFLLCKRRKDGEPFAYIVGKKEFMSMDFFVTPSVFIPRPETETLVEAVLPYIEEGMHILDIGTGAGCIIISLAKLSKKILFLFASDISFPALQIAKKNAAFHKVKIKFFCSSLFDAIKKNHFHIIVSNPPYIKREEILSLPSDIKHFEPTIAIDGGEDGLFFIKKIIKEAPSHLFSGGHLFLEIPERESVLPFVEENRDYKNFEFIKDLSGAERVLHAQKI